MAIKRIRVSNFKSFDTLDLELGNLNVLIGANASGKSNFLQIFKFLRDITQHGLKNAISLQGGVEYFRNSIIDPATPFSLEIVYQIQSREKEWTTPSVTNSQVNKSPISRHFYESVYKFSLEFTKEEQSFRVVEDVLIRKLKFCDAQELQSSIDKKKIEEMSSGIMTFANIDGKIEYKFTPEKVVPELQEAASSLFDASILFDMMPRLSPQMLFMETSHFDIMYPFGQSLHRVPIYDFDPRLPKKASPLTGKADLEEDGNNLAIVLKNIIEDEETRRKFFNLARYLLPFIEDLRVEKFADRYLIVTVQEKYNPNFYLPASFMSDGAINLLAFIVALYFEEKPLIIIEEVEKNIHPRLIARAVDMLKEASAQKQIIVTTHHPELVKHVALKNLLFVTRDKNGFSTISKPSKKEGVRTFLKNEIGIDELYIQDLLKV